MKAEVHRLVRWWLNYSPIEKGKWRIKRWALAQPFDEETLLVRLDCEVSMRILTNEGLGKRIFYNGYHEPDTVALLQRILEPGMVFFDVGANIGQFTLLASVKVGSGFVHAFEPSPTCYALLAENVHLNQLQNVVLNKVALSARSEVRNLYLSDKNRERG